MNKGLKYGIISAIVGSSLAFVFFKRHRILNYFRSLLIKSNKKNMELVLRRKIKGENFTIGELSIDGKFFCYTLEDKDRGLTDKMTLSEIESKKVKGETAIPTGTYKIDMNIVSPRFKKQGSKSQYLSIGNKLPRLLNVKGFDGVLIHIGNYIRDTDACLLVGSWYNESQGTISDSKNTFFELYDILKYANDNGKSITIKIV